MLVHAGKYGTVVDKLKDRKHTNETQLRKSKQKRKRGIQQNRTTLV